MSCNVFFVMNLFVLVTNGNLLNLQAEIVQQAFGFMKKLGYEVCGLIHDGFFVKKKGLAKAEFESNVLTKLNSLLRGDTDSSSYPPVFALEELP